MPVVGRIGKGREWAPFPGRRGTWLNISTSPARRGVGDFGHRGEDGFRERRAPTPAISSYRWDKKGLVIGNSLVAAFAVMGDAGCVIIQPFSYASTACEG
jgi:hypothetical protein